MEVVLFSLYFVAHENGTGRERGYASVRLSRFCVEYSKF
jgi:hypothetical protein